MAARKQHRQGSPQPSPPFSPKQQPLDCYHTPPPLPQHHQQRSASPPPVPSSSSSGTPPPASLSNDVYEALSAHYLFAEAPPQAIKNLAEVMHLRFFVPGDVIISEGDRGRAMFLIVRGECRVQKSGGDVVVATLKAGQFFGEIGLLFDLPRTASVIAHSRCTLLILTKPDLDAAADNFPELKAQLQREAERRLEMSRRKRQESGRKSGSPAPAGPEHKGSIGESSSSEGAEAAFRPAVHDASDISDASDYEDFQSMASYTSTPSHTPTSYAASPPVTGDQLMTPVFRRRCSSITERCQTTQPNFIASSHAMAATSTLPVSALLTPQACLPSTPPETDSQVCMSTKSWSLADESGTMAHVVPKLARSVGNAAVEDADVEMESTTEGGSGATPLKQPQVGSQPSEVIVEPPNAAEGAFTGERRQTQRELRGQSLEGEVLSADEIDFPTSPASDGKGEFELNTSCRDDPFMPPLSSKSFVAPASPAQNGSELPIAPGFRDRGLGPRRASVAVWADPGLKEQLKKVTEEHAGQKRQRSGLGQRRAETGIVATSDDELDNVSDSGESITFTSDEEAGFDDEPAIRLAGHATDLEFGNEEDNAQTVKTAESFHMGGDHMPHGKRAIVVTERGVSAFPSTPEMVARLPFMAPTKQPLAASSRVTLPTRMESSQQEPTLENLVPRPRLLSLPPAVFIKIFERLPLKSLVAFRCLSRDSRSFMEARMSQLVPLSMDLSPFHKRIDDDTLINILVTWVLPGLKYPHEQTVLRPANADDDPFLPTLCTLSSLEVQTSRPTSSRPLQDSEPPQAATTAPRGPLSLSLRNCWSLTNRSISALGPMLPHLRSLDLHGCWEVSGPGLAGLRNAPELRRIDLSNCRKVDSAAILALMAGCPNIEIIRLGYCKALTGEIFGGGRKTWGRVKRLNLQRCTGIWDAGFAHWVPDAPVEVSGEDAVVRDAGTSSTVPARNASKEVWAMEELILSDCSFLTDASIVSIGESCTQLRCLSLSFCCALTEAVADVLANRTQILTALDLSFCGTAVSDASLRELARGLRQLESLGIRGCNRVTEAGLCAVVLSQAEEEAMVQAAPAPPSTPAADVVVDSDAPCDAQERYYFVLLRSLNASQCKGVSGAALGRMAAASRGRWTATTGSIVDLQPPVTSYREYR